MDATVYTTAGGRRFHADPECTALLSAQALSDWDYDYEFPPPAGALMPQVHAVEPRRPLAAAVTGYTACRVCVPPALALPTTGHTYGHERLTINPSCCGDGCCGGREEREVCVRCSNDVSRRHGWNWSLDVPWPCTSAVVLGLALRSSSE